MITKKLGKLTITFNPDVKHKEYQCESYEILHIYDGLDEYEIVNNYLMGYRLFIKKHNGYWHDIPLRKSNFDFVPNIKIEQHE